MPEPLEVIPWKRMTVILDETTVPGSETSKLFQIKSFDLLVSLTKKPVIKAATIATGAK